jgi:hypothetical protein
MVAALLDNNIVEAFTDNAREFGNLISLRAVGQAISADSFEPVYATRAALLATAVTKVDTDEGIEALMIAAKECRVEQMCETSVERLKNIALTAQTHMGGIALYILNRIVSYTDNDVHDAAKAACAEIKNCRSNLYALPVLANPNRQNFAPDLYPSA